MSIPTIGSAEALLQMFYVAQGANGYRPNPSDLWHLIADYTQEHPQGQVFSAYLAGRFCRPDSAENEPTSLFLGDLQELLSQGVIRLQPDGCIEVTPFGKCLAFARTVPASLSGLEKRVESLAGSHHK